MSKPMRLFSGCSVRGVTQDTFENFVEVLEDLENLKDKLHPRDIKFMRDSVEYYRNKRAKMALREMSGYVHNHVDLP